MKDGTLPCEDSLDEAFLRGFMAILHRAPSQDERHAFCQYLSLLLQWNRAHNLTGYRTARDIVEKLFIDSLLFLRWIPAGDVNILDLGAGVGIPGLPMKIVEPRIKLTLVEARRLRISFLVTVVRALGLQGAQVLPGRAEMHLEAHPALRDTFDVVVARATGPLRSVIPLARAFLRPKGCLVASGPPATAQESPLPDTRCRWETIPVPGTSRSRRFLIAERFC